MATLVLSVVGAAVGGPIGQAVGAFVGREIDKRIFAPRAREGPRLGDLSVQTSSYGAAIPKLFGSVRASGTLIWSTDLVETRTTRSNGKNAPKTNVYSYSASFAVLLSARPVARIGRIWADGNLLRGEAGDFKVQTGFRLHHGHEGQPLDPLIAAAEGIDQTPAYRGMAYAVFDHCQLGDFGNRIPSLSFEVIADEGPVEIAALIADLTGRGVVAASSPSIDGLAATGDSVRGVAEVLRDAIPLPLTDDGVMLSLGGVAPPALAIDPVTLGTHRSGDARSRLSIERRSVIAVPETLSVAYYDAARDYQPGLQLARRDGGARRSGRIDLPATLTAGRAKTIIETQLTLRWAERVTARVRLPWQYLRLRPGNHITLPGSSTVWRISGTTFEQMVTTLDLVPVAAATALLTADAGRPLRQSDDVHGPTTLAIIDLPPLGDTAPRDPTVAVAAAGASAGWRRAALMASLDKGASWAEIGTTAPPAIIGTSVTTLGAASAMLLDLVNSVEVLLLNGAMDLGDADMARLLAGANLAMLGDEVIQFGRAQPLGNARWRLSNLLRGRRGTEAAIAAHGPSERFVLLDQTSLFVLDAAYAQPGVQIMAVGIADDSAPPIVTAVTVDRSLMPLSPVHPRAVRQRDGSTLINWIRRSREGWQWRDGVDAPSGEESLRFRVMITPNAGAARLTEVDSETYSYTAADRSADLAAGSTSTTFAIAHVGARGVSVPLTLTLALV